MSSKTITQNDLTNILNEIFPATSDDMTPAQIEDFVQSLNAVATSSVDYIVEQGQEGIWTYRKWNSGIAECWGITSYESAAFSASGNVFMRGFADIAFPLGLFNSAPNVFVNPIMSSIGAARSGSITASKFNVAVLSAVSTASTVDLQLHVIGTWK